MTTASQADATIVVAEVTGIGTTYRVIRTESMILVDVSSGPVTNELARFPFGMEPPSVAFAEAMALVCVQVTTELEAEES